MDKERELDALLARYTVARPAQSVYARIEAATIDKKALPPELAALSPAAYAPRLFTTQRFAACVLLAFLGFASGMASSYAQQEDITDSGIETAVTDVEYFDLWPQDIADVRI